MENKRKTTEEYLREMISNPENCANMLDFIAWAKSVNLSVKKTNQSKWSVAFKGGKNICWLLLKYGGWVLIPLKHSDFSDCDALKEYIWKSINPCNKCRSNTWTDCVKPRTICGKHFENTCASIPLEFVNPDAEKLSEIKKVISARIKLHFGG